MGDCVGEDGQRRDASGGQAPADLPRVPRLFWSARPDFDDLAELPAADVPDVLERLGPPPFPKTGFPFIGFLATIYDHVAGHAQRRDAP